MYILKSQGTRAAEKLLNQISSKDLKDFLKSKFKKIKVTSINSVLSIFNAILRGTAAKSVENFANELTENEQNMKNFLNAIEKQAKSLGTKKSGLFYKKIYTYVHSTLKKLNTNQNSDNDLAQLQDMEKQIRVFLLAKKGNDIDNTEPPGSFFWTSYLMRKKQIKPIEEKIILML